MSKRPTQTPDRERPAATRLPSRRQLLRKIVLLGTRLVVTRAAPASAVKTTACEEVKIEEESQVMLEIMHLIKIRAVQNNVYGSVDARRHPQLVDTRCYP